MSDMSDLKARIADLSPEKRARFEGRLLERAAGSVQGPEVGRRAGSGPARLSFAQQRLWFLDRLQPGSAAYNVHSAVRLTGPLDVEALQGAIGEIVRRHEILRTRFESEDGTPLQVVDPPGDWRLPVRSLAALPEDSRKAEAGRLATEEALRPFDLARGPLFRSVLLRLSESDHVLLLTMHHIVSDGWSLGILRREAALLYQAFSTGRPSPLPELPVQYADFAEWQREWLTGDVIRTQLDYWKARLAALPVLELPTDRPRPALQTDQGGRHTFRLNAALSAAVRELAQSHKATPFMVLLATFHALLHRYTGRPDIPVGSPIANRNRLETEGLIGFFVNTLIHRADFSDDPTFVDLLARVRRDAMGAFAHQDLPFEKLVEELNPQRTLTHTPLFQVMFAYQNVPLGNLELPGLVAAPFPRTQHSTTFELTLTIFDSPERLSGTFEYRTDLFEAASVHRMAGHFQALLDGILADPRRRVSQVPLLTPSESRQLLVDWTSTKTEYPSKCIHHLFEAQAERTPGRTAFSLEDEAVTYQELNLLANRLAYALQRRGVGRESVVGVFLPRSWDMIVSLFGTLKAGGAYLPLDPSYPKSRIAYMLGDANPSLILTTRQLAPMLPDSPRHRLMYVEEERSEGDWKAARNPVSDVGPDDPAYVIYTSGSTGKPKGVVGLHRGAVNRFQWMWNRYPFRSGDVSCQKTSLNFLDSLWEIFGSVSQSVPTVLVPEEAVKDVPRLIQHLSARGVTRIVLVPSLLRAILNAPVDLATPLQRLRLWVSSGEELPADLVERFYERLPSATLLNLYGSSEVSADATFLDTRDGAKTPLVPIGKPIANTRVYVLDSALQPVPIGVRGHIYVAGDGLARGYLDRPDLTAERFLPDPFSGAGDRFYSTGDVGRWLPDGELQYVGRKDHQVKVRGHRVELAEVEAALLENPMIREAVVVFREDAPGEGRLVAYFKTNGATTTTSELRSELREKLPEYALPSVFVPLVELPRTPNGKVDRSALPVPGEGRPELARMFVPAQDEVERKLVSIWQQNLRIDTVGVLDNYFELGGHSLLAVKLFAQIEKTFGRQIPLATIFQAPTVCEMARILSEKSWAASWASLVPIKPHGSRPPFYCIHAIGGNVLTYADMARHLGNDQPVYGLQAQGLDGKVPPHTRVEEMAAHYVQEIRRFQPEGPYHLGGSSFGGMVAFEVAQQLHAQGQTVGVLALFDTYGPGYLLRMPGVSQASYRFNRLRERVDLHVGNFLAAEGLRGKYFYLATKTRRAGKRMKWRATRQSEKFRDLMLPPAFRDVEKSSHKAREAYVPRVYPGRITLFRATNQPAWVLPDPHLGWSRLAAGGVDVYEVPGYHGAIVYEPRARTLAQQLSDALRKAAGEPLVGKPVGDRRSAGGGATRASRT